MPRLSSLCTATVLIFAAFDADNVYFKAFLFFSSSTFFFMYALLLAPIRVTVPSLHLDRNLRRDLGHDLHQQREGIRHVFDDDK